MKINSVFFRASLLSLSGLSLSFSPAMAAPALDATNSSADESVASYHARLHATIPEAPYTADDIQTEIVFGRELASKILGKYPPSHNDAVNAYLNKVGQNIARQSQRPELNYRFVVLKTDIINAFAAPGGYIFVTEGALNQVQDESELAAIIAHEIGHIQLRHYVKKVGLRSSKGNAEDGLEAIFSGGGRAATQAFNEAIDETLDILFNTGLQSKKDEFEADYTSVFMLANAGYDPTALKRYFARINQIKTDSMESLENTHPPLPERITQIDQIITKNNLQNLGQARLQERFNANQ